MREAEWHLQLVMESVDLAGSDALVGGRVVRVFRGSASMLGSPVSVRVPVVVPGADHPPSGISLTSPDELRVGRTLEGFFENTDRGMQAVYGLVMTLDEATDAPQHYLTAAATPGSTEGSSRTRAVLLLPALLIGGLGLYLAIRLFTH